METMNIQEPMPVEPAASRNIDVVTAEIRSLMNQAQTMALVYAIEIGRRLCEAKSLLKHGEWGQWLAEKVEYSQSTANNLMKIFEEYGDRQITLFGAAANSQTLGNLPYTKALKLLAVPAAEREQFAKENDVEHLSSRELEKLIREKKELQAAAEKAEQDSAEMKEKLEEALTEAQKKQEEAERAAEEESALREKLKEAEKKAEEAREALEAAKANTEISSDVLKKLKADAKKELADLHKKETQRLAEEMNRKVAKAEALKRKAEAEAREAQQTAEDLQKKLKIAAPEVAQFEMLFQRTQEDLLQCAGLIGRIRKEDEELAGRLEGALKRVIEGQLEEMKGEKCIDQHTP